MTARCSHSYPETIASHLTGPPRSGRRLGRFLAALVFAVVAGLITHGTFAGSGDEVHYLMIAHSIAYDGDLDLANDYRDSRLIGAGVVEPGAHVVERDGRLLPVHDIGMPLALMPLVWAANQHAGQINRWLPEWFKNTTRLNEALLFRHWVSLIMAALTALLAVEMFRTLRLLDASNTAAFCWSLLFAATPPVLSHSFLFFTEIPTALIALFVFRRIRLQPVGSVAAATAIGLLTGYLLLIHIRNVGLVAGLIAIAMLQWRERHLASRHLAWFMGGIAVMAVARTGVNLALWGSFVATPHTAITAPASIAAMLREVFERATGLLFDRDFGLIAYAPIYVLAGVGLVLLRRHPRLARDVSIVLACYLVPVLLPASNVHGWRGGFSPAARYLLPIVPMLWIAVFAATRHLTGTGRVVIWTLVAVQIGMDAFVWQEPKTLWKDEDGSIVFPPSQWLPAWTDHQATLSFVAIAAVISLCLVLFMRFAVRSQDTTPPDGVV